MQKIQQLTRKCTKDQLANSNLSHTNVAFVVSLVNQFMHQPKEIHLQTELRIVQYLKETLGKGILFKWNGIQVLKYIQILAESIMDKRPTLGYCTFLGGNLLTWKRKKQSVVARSSTEAEFRGTAKRIYKLLWLKFILTDLEIKQDEPMRLSSDNKFIISIAYNPV